MIKDYFLATLMMIIFFGTGGLIFEIFGYLITGIKSSLSRYLYPAIYLVVLAIFMMLIFI
jgi:hypothetical protein